MNSMLTIAGAAMAAATRIYCDELDGILDRHFPQHSVRVSVSDSAPYYVEETSGTFWVVSKTDSWSHSCYSYAQAAEIASIMNGEK